MYRIDTARVGGKKGLVSLSQCLRPADVFRTVSRLLCRRGSYLQEVTQAFSRQLLLRLHKIKDSLFALQKKG
jgi:hypothetical protein